MNNIQVLGTGCPSCKKLYELTQQAVRELEFTIDVEYITDIQKILEMGVMSSPVLAIDGKAVLMGQVPSLERIKELVLQNTKATESTAGGCSCGGSC